MCWCFATINNKPGEIYFDKNKNGRIKFLAHCYVKREDFKNREELKYFDKDIKNLKVVYKNKKYKAIQRGENK